MGFNQNYSFSGANEKNCNKMKVALTPSLIKLRDDVLSGFKVVFKR